MGEEIFDIFYNYGYDLVNDQHMRMYVKSISLNLDRISREICAIMYVFHKSDEEGIAEACMMARAKFGEARATYQKLKAVVPSTDYYRFHEQWRSATQKLCYAISLIVWLETGTMVEQETIADILGITAEEEPESFHLDIQDYLIGLLNLCSELSRYAVNLVIHGKHQRVVNISRFVKELNTGFRSLNLKNDYLRYRFDSLKYNVKKIETILYDLRVRGLVNEAL